MTDPLLPGDALLPTGPIPPAAPVPEAIRAVARSQLRSEALRKLAGNLGSVVISLIATVIIWEAFIKGYHLSKVVARDPIDVYRYLFTVKADKAHALRSAAGNRHVLFGYLRTTLRDAAVGFVAGTVAALLVSAVFVLQRTVEQAFMPVALVLRSVPLVAMTPLITLIFGRDILCVAVIGGIVCFFPALVNIVFGLRAAPRSAVDLLTSYGASKTTILRKVLLPSAIPSIFAALRINVPAAVVGALLAEFLATNAGTGYEMQQAANLFDIGELWSAVVLVTMVSIIAYSIVSAVEAAVLSRFAATPAR